MFCVLCSTLLSSCFEKSNEVLPTRTVQQDEVNFQAFSASSQQFVSLQIPSHAQVNPNYQGDTIHTLIQIDYIHPQTGSTEISLYEAVVDTMGQYIFANIQTNFLTDNNLGSDMYLVLPGSDEFNKQHATPLSEDDDEKCKKCKCPDCKRVRREKVLNTVKEVAKILSSFIKIEIKL